MLPVQSRQILCNGELMIQGRSAPLDQPIVTRTSRNSCTSRALKEESHVARVCMPDDPSSSEIPAKPLFSNKLDGRWRIPHAIEILQQLSRKTL